MKEIIDTPEVKKEMKAKLKHYFRAKWSAAMAEKTGFTADYIRLYFRTEIMQAEIAAAGMELIAAAQKKEQEILNRIKD